MSDSKKIGSSSRRTVLRATGAALLAGMAGCSGIVSQGSAGTPAESTTAPKESSCTPTESSATPTESTDATAESTVEVTIEDYKFVPGTDEPLEIDAGTTVRFVLETSNHNVVVEKRPMGSDWEGHETVEDAGYTFEHTFDTPGTFWVVCKPHEKIGGQGTIIVE